MSALLARALVAALGVLLLVAPGLAIAKGVPALRRSSRLIRIGYAYLLGAAFLGAGAYAASHLLGLRLRRGLFVVLALMPIAAAVLNRSGFAATDSRSPRRVTTLEFLVIAIAAFVSLGLFAEALTNPVTDHDGRMTWEVQTRHLHEERTVDMKVLTEARWAITHPQYPLLVALDEVAALDVFDVPVTRDDERVTRPLLAAFYPALLLVLFDQARRRVGRRAALLATLCAATLPFLSVERFGGAAGTYRDLPLGCFWGAGTLLLFPRRARLPEALAAGLLLVAAVLTKNEGTVLAAGSPLVAAVARVRPIARSLRMRSATRLRAALGPLLAATAVVTAAVLLLASWRHAIPNRYDEVYESRLSVANVVKGLQDRPPVISSAAVTEATRIGDWGLLFAVAPVFLAFSAVRRRWRAAAWPLALAITPALGLYVSAYALSTWGSIREVVHITFGRFALQLSLPLFVLVAMGIRAGLGAETLTRGSSSG